MSNQPRIPLQIERAVDPILNLDNVRKYTVYDGGSEVSYVQYPCQAPSQSSSEFTCNPPDDSSVTDPRVYVGMVYNLVAGGTYLNSQISGAGVTVPNGRSLINMGMYDAPRAFPISQTLGTISCTINGNTLTTNLNTYLNSFLHMNMWKSALDGEYSECPNMLDQFQEYSIGTGTDRNPLGRDGSNVSQTPRGAWGETLSTTPAVPAPEPNGQTSPSPNVTISVWRVTAGPVYTPLVYPFINTSGGNEQHIALIQFGCTEPLLLSPFFGCKSGFTNIRTMKVVLTYANLYRIWSHDNTNGVTIADAQWQGTVVASTLYFRYVKPKPFSVVPAMIPYAYHEIQQVNANVNNIAANTSGSFTLPALNLSATPWRLIVYVGEQLADVLTSPSKSDTFCRIDKITVNWGQNQGKLANCTRQDLYLMSQRNGCTASFVDWNKGCGSVLAIDVGKDIGLPSDVAPGSTDSPQLSMTVNYTNINTSRAINAVLYCYVVYEGTVVISAQQMSKNIANLTKNDVLLSYDATKTAQVVARPSIMWTGGSVGVGGNWWDSVKNFGRKVYNAVKPYAPEILSLGRKVIGLGYGRRYGGGMMEEDGQQQDNGEPTKRARMTDEKYASPIDSGMDPMPQDDGMLQQDYQEEDEMHGGGQLISRAELQRNLRQDNAN